MLKKRTEDIRGHTFNFDECKILATENKVRSRKFLEAVHSKLTSNSINRSVDIPPCYYNILKKQFNWNEYNSSAIRILLTS